MKSLPLILLLIGIICITIGYTKITRVCPRPKVEYKYVPQSVYAEQLSSQELLTPGSNIESLFTQDTIIR
tara:strand:+ start:282 stop:491 length:210 start_codon:yes stop_codon:yes gene_type:complete